MAQDNSNSHITSYLDYYTKMEIPPRHAVLLTGAWGSGKTRFITNYIETSDENPAYLYVSLYGASDTSDIAERIFLARRPLLASKGAVVAGKIIKGLVSAAFKITDEDLRDIGQVSVGLPDVTGALRAATSTGGRVLVLDDIERATVPPPELWGFINRIVEQEQGKVILVANEDKLAAQYGAHGETKEKNIGMTLHFRSNVGQAFDAFVREHQNSPSLADALDSNKDSILQLYQQSNCQSLRVLRLAILDYTRVFDALHKDIQDIPEAVAQMRTTALALAFEVHAGNISPHDIPKLNDSESFLLRRSVASFHGTEVDDGDIDDAERRRHSLIVGKYGNVAPFSYTCPSLEWWRQYFERGEIDRGQLEAQTRRRYLKETPSWEALARFNTLTDADFSRLLTSTWNELVECSYSDVGAILHVAGVHLWAQSEGLSPSEPKEIKDAAVRAIEKLDDEVILDGYREIHLGRSYGGIVFAGLELPHFLDLMSKLKDLVTEANVAANRIRARRLLDALPLNDGSFSRLLSPDMAGDNEGTFLLEDVAPSEFAERLRNLDPLSQSWVIQEIGSKTPKSHGQQLHEWATEVLDALESAFGGPSLRLIFLRRDLQRLMRQ
ncbi:MAG: P-loop NTPase fold protein [Enhygromyxa sp.]